MILLKSDTEIWINSRNLFDGYVALLCVARATFSGATYVLSLDITERNPARIKLDISADQLDALVPGEYEVFFTTPEALSAGVQVMRMDEEQKLGMLLLHPDLHAAAVSASESISAGAIELLTKGCDYAPTNVPDTCEMIAICATEKLVMRVMATSECACAPSEQATKHIPAYNG